MGMFGEQKVESDEPEVVDLDVGGRRNSKSPQRGPTGGGLGSAVGVLLVVCGIALAALPTLVPQYAWAVNSAAKYGATAGLLALGGLVLIGLGRVVRHVNRSAAAIEQTNTEDMEMLEHLVLDFTKMRDGVQELRQELLQLREASTTILQTTVGLSEAQSSEGRQDAIFRMAASLDQVGARIEHRLGTQSTALQDTLTELSNSISATHKLVTELASAPPRHSSSHEPGYESRVESRGRAPHRSPEPPLPAPESDLDVWVELDNDEPRSLGLLDTLDDQGQAHTKKTSLSLERPRTHDASQPGPLPKIIRNQQSNAALLGREAGDGVRSIPRDASVDDKIDQLKSLLSDARVRKALEIMQSEGPQRA